MRLLKLFLTLAVVLTTSLQGAGSNYNPGPGLRAVEDDTAPKLGANFDVNGNSLFNATDLDFFVDSGNTGMNFNASSIDTFYTDGGSIESSQNLTNALFQLFFNNAGNSALVKGNASDVRMETQGTGRNTSLIMNGEGMTLGGADMAFLQLGSRTTANRPATPLNGMMGYNTTLAKFEAYEAGSWANLIQDVSGFLSNIVEDLSPQLGANLDLNTKTITNLTGVLRLAEGGDPTNRSLEINSSQFIVEWFDPNSGGLFEINNGNTHFTYFDNADSSAGEVSANNTSTFMEFDNGAGAITRLTLDGLKYDFGGTGALQLTDGTTAQRPTPINGMIRYNLTLAKFEAYEAGAWVNMISAAGGGEANTASDGGTGGVGLTLTKSGVDLPFKNLIAASTKIAVVNDGGNSNVTFDVNEANLTLDNIGGTLDETKGGTGQTVYVIGDILSASTTIALSKIADIATGNVLLSGGVGLLPLYGNVGLT